MLLSAAALALAATPAFAAVTANPTLTGTTVSTIPAITLTSDLAAGTAIDWEITGPSPGNAFSINGSGPWPVTTLPAQAPGDDGLYTLSATDVGGAQTAIATFTVDRTPPGAPGTPTITGTNPTPLATPTFSWTAVQDPGDSFEWQVLVNGTVTQTSTTTATSVTAAALGTGTYSFQVRQRDALLNTGSFSPALAFTVDLAAPTGGVIAHVPVANQVAGFTRTANVSINLTTASVDNLAGTLTYALTATSTPAPSAAAFAAWTAARPFTVTATQGAATTVFLWARDAAGNISPAPVASTPITFDNQGPTVLGTSFPLPGVNLTTAFGTLANVRINFNEPVQNPVSLIRMCVNPCGLPIAAAVTYGEITGPIALLDPAATLAIGTTYEIELPAVRDRAGNLLTGPGSSQWTFTTSSDGTPPGPVAGLAAVPGVGQVALSWKPPTDADLARITVLRSTIPPTSPGDGTAARFSLPANATSFTDVALAPGVTYYYAVYAEDAVGNPSELARTSAVPKAPLVAVVIAGRPKPPKGIFDRFMTPKKGKVLGTLRPILRWRATKGAVLYNIQIVDLNPPSRKVVSAFPRKPAYRVPPKRLKQGHRYAWRVWAYRGKKKGYVKVPMTTWFDTSPKAKK